MSDCNLCESGAGGGSHTRKGCVYSRTCKVCEKEGISAKYFGESGRSGYNRMKETPETSGPTTLRMPSANISNWSIQTEWENPQRSLTRWRGHSGPVRTGKSRKESESHWMSLTNSWTASLSTTSQGDGSDHHQRSGREDGRKITGLSPNYYCPGRSVTGTQSATVKVGRSNSKTEIILNFWPPSLRNKPSPISLTRRL